MRPEDAGRLVQGYTQLREKCRVYEVELARLEGLVAKHEDALEKRANANGTQIQELRVSVANLADSTRDITAVKKLVTWGLGIMAPLLLIGSVNVIQSMGRQETMEKSIEHQASKYVVIEAKIHGVEMDVSAIKSEQALTRKTLENVSDTLQDLKESQIRMEDSIRPRRRRAP